MRSRKVMAILTAVCMSVSMAGAVNAEENTGADPSQQLKKQQKIPI